MTATWQQCAGGHETAESDRRPRCSQCDGLLEIRHAPPRRRGEALRQMFDERCGAAFDHPYASGVWRFKELVLPNAGEDIVSQPEGNTPLFARQQISRWTGSDDLLIKHEGHNPTGSFK